MLATRGGSLRRICECMTATNLVSSSARTERSTPLVDLDCAGRALARNWVWLEEPSRRPIRQWSPPRDTSRSDGHSPSTWPDAPVSCCRERAKRRSFPRVAPLNGGNSQLKDFRFCRDTWDLRPAGSSASQRSVHGRDRVKPANRAQRGDVKPPA